MKNLKTSMKKGFSLVELLVVIAVIGVIAAIAIPAMSGIFGKSEQATYQKNAQAVVSTFNAARAAGNTEGFTDAGAMVDAVTAGSLKGGGKFSSSEFSVPLDPTAITEVKKRVGLIHDATNDSPGKESVLTYNSSYEAP